MAFQDLFQGCRHVKPCCFINFGKGLHPPGPGRPFDIESIAFDFFYICILEAGPGKNCFTSFLLNRCERCQRSCYGYAGFFCYLSPGGCKRGFVFLWEQTRPPYLSSTRKGHPGEPAIPREAYCYTGKIKCLRFEMPLYNDIH